MSAPFWGETPPATPVSPEEAVAIARDLFGLDAAASPLGSNQETNLRIEVAGGERYVLKVANPGFGDDVLDLQNKAMRHVARAGTGLKVPVPVPALDGSDLVRVPIRGRDHHVRLLSFVEGEMFSDAAYLGDEVLGRFGALAARLSGALATFDHAAADRTLQDDSRNWNEEFVDCLVAVSLSTWPVVVTLRASSAVPCLDGFSSRWPATCACRWWYPDLVD